MKRELAFALNSYSQLTVSLGRTRSSKPRPDGDFDDVSGSQSTGKRRKGSKWTESEPGGEINGLINRNLVKENGISAATGSKKPTSNGVVCEAQMVMDDAAKGVPKVAGESTQPTLVPQTELTPLNYLNQVVASNSGASDDDMNQTGPVVEMNGSNGASVLTPTKKLEMKMSKKIGLSKVPKTVKELFATGLLEGYPVFYNSGTQGPPVRGLIKDVGILCLCSSCGGSKVFNPCQFEIHACNSYRRAAQYICLENGTSLLDVVKACKQSRLDSLEETIHQVVGALPVKESIICLNCKGSFVSTTAEKLEQQCKRCVSSMDSDDRTFRSLQLVSPLRRSNRNVSETISSQDISGENISSQDISGENISSQDITEDKIAEDSVPKSSLAALRRSSRNVTGGILSSDGNQGKISQDGSSISSLLPITPKSSSVHVSSQGRTELKIAPRPLKLDLTPEFSGSISELIFQENKSPKIIPVSSKSILGSRAPKSSSVRMVSLSSQQKGKWKITRKDQRLHRLVFEDGGLPDGTEVAYYSDGQKLLEGYKEGAGIFCRCCDSVVTASGFEAHAGRASRRKPYNYIYTSNGVSLHEFAVSLLKSRNCSAKDNDDLCSICADGGNLLLCDGCPRAFHKECASLSSVPLGKWYCQYCQNMFVRERFVECNANAVAAGRVSGVDLIEQITQRCIRIVKTREDVEVIACVLCRGYDFCKSGFGPRTVIVCDQCEKEYHVGCLKEHNMADLEELPEGKWFCCKDCRSIFSDMQNLLSRGEEGIHDSLLSVIKQKHEEIRSDTVIQFEVKWRVLNGKIASPENRLLLSKAVSIFHESFDPIIDSATGHDYIPSMVYGRNISGQDFAGMYCAVLMVNSYVVSAGLFRVFGQVIAELPLVATSNCHQGKGYFQLLFSCIEKLLACLNVKTLVLPAAPEAESIWTDKFGFEKIDQEKLSDYRKTYWQMLTFQGTCMLQKAVPSFLFIQ